MKRIKFILIRVLVICLIPFFNPASFCTAQGHIWTEKSSMPDLRWGHSSCELDGKIYILGGMKIFSSPTIPLNTVWMYDPVLDTCIAKKNMDIVRTGFSTCNYNGKIYAIGGAQQIYGNPTITTSSIDAYDPEQNSWTHITDMPVTRYDHTAAIVGSKIYIIGGYDHPFANPFNQVDIFDLSTETWTTGAPMPTPRVQLCSVVLNGKIYTIGGQKGVSTNESGEKTVEIYDPAEDIWTSAADMLTKRKMMSASILDGRIYVFGGAEGYCTSALSGMQAYKPETDTWDKIGDMPRALAKQSSTVVNNKIYISGGLEGNCSSYEMFSMIYEFVPDTAVPVAEDYIKGGISIFPNPADNEINVEVENIGNATIEIYDLMGRLLYSNVADLKIEKIDISSYKAGLYLIKIKQKNRNYIGNFMVR